MGENKNRGQLDIVMFIPGMAFQGDSYKEHSLGGSETMGSMMAIALAKLGHNVLMFNNCPQPGTYNGVNHLPAEKFAQYASTMPHDVTIAQRLPDVYGQRLVGKIHLLWQHDLALLRQMDRFKSALWNVDRVITVSQYMTDQYKEVYGLPDELFWTSRNAVDLELLNSVNVKERNRKQIVYTARPERGLDVLLTGVMPKLIKKDSEYKLVVAGYDNTVPQMEGFYKEMHRLIQELGDNATWAGNLNKQQLYELYASSGLYVYPTPSSSCPEFNEVSCITVCETGALGLPFLSSNRGALPETCHKDACSLLDGDPWTDEYQEKFVDEVLAITQDDIRWRNMSGAAKLRSKDFSIDTLAEEWQEEIYKLIRDRNGDPVRLALHFMRRSDIFAAQKALDQAGDSPMKSRIQLKLQTNWGFSHNTNSFKKHYETMGKETDERLSKLQLDDNYFDETNESRFHIMEQLLKDNTDLEKILNYGGGHGWDTTYLERRVGRKWVGVDIDKKAIKWAETFRDRFCKNPENVKYVVGTHATDLSDFGKFDCLLMSEVLEHCIDPVEVVNYLEKWIKPGGLVFITVPYGPREYPAYDKLKHRNHLHELDSQTLREMFSKKKAVEILGIYESEVEELKQPAGFYMVRYRVDHSIKCGKINWERKLSIQRPRQTVSLAMIAGESADETLRWCLNSTKHVADEIVIGDCGMSEDAKRVAESYGATIYKAPVPTEHGFDAARNSGLDKCTMDWIMWIDTDEKLIGAENSHKYLRDNLFNGYSIRQHHFAIDTAFKPDMPVRLFRNREVDGKRMRFHGCVTGDTLIDTLHGLVPIKDLVGNQPLVYGYDTKENHLTIAKADQVCCTRKNAEILEITLDDDSTIKVTPDHLFLMRHHYESADSYKRADELKPGDSLMPMYRTVDSLGYSSVRVSNKVYIPEHRFVYETLIGSIPEGYILHHKDQNPSNNHPSNLYLCTNGRHTYLHHIGKIVSSKTRKKISDNHAPCHGEYNSMYGKRHSDGTKSKIGEKSIERGAMDHPDLVAKRHTSESAIKYNKRTWADPIIRTKRIWGIKRASAMKKYGAPHPLENHKVKSIKTAGFADVYNMEVPGPHNYVANGVVVHNCVHEHPEFGVNEGPGLSIVLSDVHIAHVGYLIESSRRKRFWRNNPLLKKSLEKYPERLLNKHFIMRDNMLLCTYELQRNGGIVTDYISKMAEETIAVYREHFLGKGSYLNVDALEYYSQACRMLNLGAEVAFCVNASKDESPQPDVKHFRFASEEDLQKELSWRAKEAMDQYTSKWW